MGSDVSGELRGKSVVVTGASSGIGVATARAFGAAGARVVLAARREDRLRALVGRARRLRSRGGGGGHRHARRGADSRAVRACPRALRRRRRPGQQCGAGPWSAAVLGIDRAVARDARGERARALHRERARRSRDMERRGVAGHVVHVSSMAGHRIPGAGSAMYAATKFAVRALTEGLRQRAARAAEPDPRELPCRLATSTPSSRRSSRARRTRPPSSPARLKVLEPDDVAATILWVVERPAHVEVHDVLVRPTAQKN